MDGSPYSFLGTPSVSGATFQKATQKSAEVLMGSQMFSSKYSLDCSLLVPKALLCSLLEALTSPSHSLARSR